MDSQDKKCNSILQVCKLSPYAYLPTKGKKIDPIYAAWVPTYKSDVSLFVYISKDLQMPQGGILEALKIIVSQALEKLLF